MKKTAIILFLIFFYSAANAQGSLVINSDSVLYKRFFSFFSKYYKYPEAGIESHESGFVKSSFTLNSEYKLIQLSIDSSSNSLFDKEALRVLKLVEKDQYVKAYLKPDVKYIFFTSFGGEY